MKKENTISGKNKIKKKANEKNIVPSVENVNKKLPIWAIVLISIIGLFFLVQIGLLLFSFIFTFNNESYIEKDGVILIDKGDLTITSNTTGYYNEEDKNYYIVGYLHNNSKRNYEFVQVNYVILDIKGNVLGTATASLDNLKANSTWKFKAIYDQIDAEEALTYDFSGLTY